MIDKTTKLHVCRWKEKEKKNWYLSRVFFGRLVVNNRLIKNSVFHLFVSEKDAFG